ncbi:hypothetical protein CXX84_16160 [Arthrobacter sp. AFG7.2]|uniref:discoidin domain-containing protein n=1 Tax=Arthrobacter sp. AFG7.2 TaxID=1688693 RepID=UPI000C9EB431|nr:discoidin domain-containing protein [Arthrobacter sp. AFG7.2]PNI07592.1 hypothetical protein CXX84_16160 [Arthrobacter sp. AFG7.2]
MTFSVLRTQRPVAALAAAVTAAAGLVLLPATPAAAAEATPVSITPNPASRGEAFQGWGTSLVWFANATAGYSPELREELYQKVFGEDGLNLNIARYNVGGGNASDVRDYLNDGSAVEGWWKPVTEPPAGTAPSNLYNPDGSVDPAQANKLAFLQQWNPDDPASYNPDADQNQRWWVERLAADQQITHWEAFSNSPPWFMTKSGYVSGQVNPAKGENLLPEAEGKFAAYMKHAVELLETGSGITVDTIDPFNEPNSGYWGTDIDRATGKPPTGYTQKQEGALIHPAAQDRVTKLLAAELAKDGTSTDAVISAMDETDPARFMTNWHGYSQQAKDAVAQLNVHTYGTNDRRRVRDLAKSTDKPLWMSEVGGFWTGNPALGDSTSGWDRSNITNGLGIAGRMVNDLRELEPDAWVFWQPVEDTYKQEKADKGWGSIYIDFDCNYEGREGFSNRRVNDGASPENAKCKVLTNQKYNTTRNFTHYIKPGDFLIQNDNAKTASAVDADGNGATLVHFNDTPAPEKVTIDLSRFGTIAPGATVTPVVTTKSPLEDIERNALVKGTPVAVDTAAKSATLEVPAASVVTFVVDGVSGVAADAAPVKDGHTYHLTGDASGKYLTARGDGSAAIQDLGTTTAEVTSQLWTFTAVGGEEFAHDRRWVVTSKDGRVLTGSGGVTAASQSGAAIVKTMTLDEAKETPSAQWILTTENGKQWSLVNAAAAIALQVTGNQTAEGTGVSLASSTGTTATATGSTHQSWSFTDLANLKLTGTRAVELSTPVGVAPVLPATVTPLYAKGDGRPVAVQWQAVDPAVWNKRGTVTITGSGTDVYGQTFSDAKATVTVGKYTATDPVSATVGVGATPAEVQAAAPAAVPGQVGTSTARNDLAVTWDWSTLDPATLQTPGTATVRGKADTGIDGGKPLDALLTVLVVDRVASSNICRDDPATTVTASYTEGSYVARNTCDGNASTRWSNWVSGGRSADSLTYGFSRDYMVDSVTVTLAEKAPQNLKVQYQDGSGAWQDTSAGTVSGLTTSAPAKVSFDAVTTRGIRVVLATPGSYTKVAEVAIAGTRLADAGVADLGRLLVDQKSVVGFAAGTSGYTVLTASAAVPAVAAYPLDTNAKVTVVQAAAENPAAAVTVTAPDGTVREYTLTFVTGKTACSNGGWAANIEPGFRTEGECVSYFAAR